MQLLFPILILGFMYLMIFVPENKRRKQFNEMVSKLKVGDKIMTKGGVIGIITELDEKNFVLATGPDEIEIEFSRSAIGLVLAEELADDEDYEDEEYDDEEYDEDEDGEEYEDEEDDVYDESYEDEDEDEK